MNQHLEIDKSTAVPGAGSPPVASSSVGQAQILAWMDELRDAAKGAPWAEPLDFAGIDTLDVLLSPIYLAILNTLRKGSLATQPPALAMWNRARDVGYRVKTSLRERALARQSAVVAPADAVLWSRDITHTVILLPVLRALEEQGTSCRTVACQARVFETLARRDQQAVFSLGAWPRIVKQARREGARRAKQLAAAGPWKLPALANAPSQVVHEAVRDTVIRFIPLVSEAIANARAVLDQFRPGILVVGNDLTLEGRAACRVAAARRVPTAMFMHGSIAGDGLQALHCADRVLVYGNIHRRELVQQGMSAQRIVVCGAPNLDERPRQTGQIHPLLQARLGLRPEDPWILVATSGPGHRISHQHHEIVIEQLVKLSQAFPEVPVVVKLHRKDRLEYYQQGLKDCAASRLTIVAEDAHGFPRDIFEWLQGCRVVLTGASAVAVESMLMEVPVVTMDFRDEIHAVDFIEAGATSHVRTPEALVATVGEIIAAGKLPPDAQSRVRAYLHEAFFALDGRSSQRGAQALAEMIAPQVVS